MRVVRLRAPVVQLVPQSALSQVSGAGPRDLDRSASAANARCPTLPRRLYAAGRAAAARRVCAPRGLRCSDAGSAAHAGAGGPTPAPSDRRRHHSPAYLDAQTRVSNGSRASQGAISVYARAAADGSIPSLSLAVVTHRPSPRESIDARDFPHLLAFLFATVGRTGRDLHAAQAPPLPPLRAHPQAPSYPLRITLKSP
jgi:hypothetical protein